MAVDPFTAWPAPIRVKADRSGTWVYESHSLSWLAFLNRWSALHTNRFGLIGDGFWAIDNAVVWHVPSGLPYEVSDGKKRTRIGVGGRRIAGYTDFTARRQGIIEYVHAVADAAGCSFPHSWASSLHPDAHREFCRVTVELAETIRRAALWCGVPKATVSTVRAWLNLLAKYRVAMWPHNEVTRRAGASAHETELVAAFNDFAQTWNGILTKGFLGPQTLPGGEPLGSMFEWRSTWVAGARVEPQDPIVIAFFSLCCLGTSFLNWFDEQQLAQNTKQRMSRPTQDHIRLLRPGRIRMKPAGVSRCAARCGLFRCAALIVGDRKRRYCEVHRSERLPIRAEKKRERDRYFKALWDKAKSSIDKRRRVIKDYFPKRNNDDAAALTAQITRYLDAPIRNRGGLKGVDASFSHFRKHFGDYRDR